MSDCKLIYGVVGTQNTGKSTFISDVIEHSRDRLDKTIRFSNDSVDYRKKIAELGLEINRNGNEKCQTVIFNTLFENITNNMAVSKTNRVILDRTPLDAYVYTLWHNVYGDGSISRNIIDEMWVKTVYSMKVLDRIFWIPLRMCDGVKVVDDKFRDTNLEYRSQIDALFEVSIQRMIAGGFTNITFLYGNRNERVDVMELYERIDSSVR